MVVRKFREQVIERAKSSQIDRPRGFAQYDRLQTFAVYKIVEARKVVFAHEASRNFLVERSRGCPLTRQSDRGQMNVGEKPAQIVVVGDALSAERSAKKRTVPFIPHIEIHRVCGHKFVHERRYATFAFLAHHEVRVIWHEGICEKIGMNILRQYATEYFYR